MYHPQVVVSEYAACFGPRAEWIMPYDSEHVWDGSLYHEASLAALERLAARHGYALVACDTMGVNAFFVDRVLAEGRFTVGRPAGNYYASPRYGDRLDFGHPLVPRKQ